MRFLALALDAHPRGSGRCCRPFCLFLPLESAIKGREVGAIELVPTLDRPLVDPEREAEIGMADLLRDVDRANPRSRANARVGPPQRMGRDSLADQLNAQLTQSEVGRLNRGLDPMIHVGHGLPYYR